MEKPPKPATDPTENQNPKSIALLGLPLTKSQPAPRRQPKTKVRKMGSEK
jgi:hypothetical protein